MAERDVHLVPRIAASDYFDRPLATQMGNVGTINVVAALARAWLDIGLCASGQYMATFPELNIVAIATSHNQGNIGAPLDAMQTHLLPLFVK